MLMSRLPARPTARTNAGVAKRRPNQADGKRWKKMDKQTRAEQLRLFKEQAARYSNESELPFSVPPRSEAVDQVGRNLEPGQGFPRPRG
jgi:hypothetical protein